MFIKPLLLLSLWLTLSLTPGCGLDDDPPKDPGGNGGGKGNGNGDGSGGLPGDTPGTPGPNNPGGNGPVSPGNPFSPNPPLTGENDQKDYDAIKLSGRWLSPCFLDRDRQDVTFRHLFGFDVRRQIWFLAVFNFSGSACEERTYTELMSGSMTLGPNTAGTANRALDVVVDNRMISADRNDYVQWFNQTKVFQYDNWKVGELKGIMNRTDPDGIVIQGMDGFDVVEVRGDSFYHGGLVSSEKDRPSKVAEIGYQRLATTADKAGLLGFASINMSPGLLGRGPQKEQRHSDFKKLLIRSFD